MESIGSIVPPELPLTKAGRVARLPAPPVSEEFFDRYVWPNQPVVIRGLVDHWRREERWTPDALANILGDRPVRVTRSHGAYDFDRDSDYWYAEENDTLMPFAKLARQMGSTDRSRQCLYLHQKSIPEKFPELKEHAPTPELVPDGSLMMLNLWVGTGGNVSSLHFDQPNNFLTQLHGRKKLILYDPFQLAYLYPSTRIAHFSRVNPESPDLERFPEFAKARSLEVELEPGDTLFLPPFWWHQVHSLSASVSVNMFWTSYTHQLLTPAMILALPALYPQMGDKYARYLPGRLPQLIDFASHALDKGFALVATVFACAALKQWLQRAARQRLGAGEQANLPDFVEAHQLGARLVAVGELSADQAERIDRWIEDGRAALERVAAASNGNCDGNDTTVESVREFISSRQAEPETEGGVYLEL